MESGLDMTSNTEILQAKVFPKEQRELAGPLGTLVSLASVALALFTLYMAFNVTFGPIPTRAAHLLFAIPLILFLYPASDRWAERPSILDHILVLASASSFAWAIYSADRFASRMAYFDPVRLSDLVFGSIALLAVFEATRRTVGMSIVVLNLLLIVYALTGPLWPGLLQHKGTEFSILIEHLYILPDGLFNFIMGLMATFLFTFLMFGAFLQVSGGDKVFTDFALAVAGHRRGGPAKVAVVSSSLMGMLSGSTVSNVITSGSMTIPMMKRYGFRPYEAAAIETAASVGGALMPPLMGAGIFIMAAFTGIPLVTIMAYSVAPAIIYFASIYFYVDIRARKRQLERLPRESLPRLRETMKRGGHLFIPIALLMYLLIVGYTPFYASSICVIMLVLVGQLRSETRLTSRTFYIALEASTRLALTVSALAASAAIIYGLITVTGLLIKVTSIILSLSGGSTFLAIILVAFMSFVLGMGLPVTAAYVLIAALGVPALADLGLPVLTAHLIIFWLSQDSTITPPICMTAFVAARIARAPPMRTGWESMLFAKGLYLMPFMFAYSDLLSNSVAEVLFDFVTILGGIALLPVVVEGYVFSKLTVVERVLFGIAAGCFLIAALGPMVENWLWLLAAVALTGMGILLQWRNSRAAQKSIQLGGNAVPK